MTIYSWGNDAPIEKLQIVPFGKKAQEAVLYAASDADSAQLSRIPDMFRSLGLTAVADVKDDQYVLRIRDFGSEQEVTSALEKNGFVNAQDQKKEKSPKDKKEKVKFADKVRQKSLTAAGFVYLIGDAALIAAGVKRKDMNETMTGLAFTSSSIVLARYGEKKVEKAFGDLYDKMLAEFSREGVDLPDYKTANAEELGKPGGIIERIEGFLFDHPAEVNNAINAYAGVQLFLAGKNQKNIPKSIAGGLVATGMLTGLLVPEKGKKEVGAEGGVNPAEAWVAPEEGPKGLMGTLMSPVTKVSDWVQEKPLRVGGYMAMANNVFQAAGAIKEKRDSDGALAANQAALDGVDEGTALGAPFIKEELQAQRAELEKDKGNWMFNMTASAAYMVANGLLSISSKDAKVGAGKEGKFDDLYAASASILAAQPPELRDEMIDKMAFYLAEQKEISESPEDVATKMREKVELLSQSPWLARAMQQAATVNAQENAPTR